MRANQTEKSTKFGDLCLSSDNLWKVIAIGNCFVHLSSHDSTRTTHFRCTVERSFVDDRLPVSNGDAFTQNCDRKCRLFVVYFGLLPRVKSGGEWQRFSGEFSTILVKTIWLDVLHMSLVLGTLGQVSLSAARLAKPKKSVLGALLLQKQTKVMLKIDF
jgi:hypothetical protein